MDIKIRMYLYRILLVSFLLPLAPLAAAHDLPGSQFVGVWQHIGNFRKFKTEPVLTPEAAALIAKLEKLRAKGDYAGDNSALCIPNSLPTMITIGAQEILVDEKKITWIMESISGIRWIWLDGRELPDLEETRPAAFGHSVGHWEGEILVVESIGFLSKSNIYANRPNNESVFPGPEMHVLERMHVEENGNVIISERTITDPKNFAVPWVTKVRYERRHDWEIAESICAENNQIEEYQ
jgi:hypothetical protein